MRIATFRPSAALAPFVDELAIVESEVDVTRALLPELGLILGIRFAGAAHHGTTRLPDTTLTGVQAAVRQISTAAGGGIVLAHFKPGGAAACFREPLHELFGAHAPLDALLPHDEVDRARDRIAAAPSHARRAAVLDDLLVARIAAPPDRIVALAARKIEAAGGCIRIADLASQLGLSQDPLEKRFRRAVGASPKQLAMLVRVRRAIALAAGAPRSLAHVALAAGYFDQSHFNREFRAVTGEPPTTFFRDTAYC